MEGEKENGGEPVGRALPRRYHNGVMQTMRFQKLEMLRGFAAFYVFLGHLLLSRLPQSFVSLRFVLSFGQEAVMVFFLLSGLVVCYSTHHHRDKTFVGYFGRRWKRIYPIFFLSMLVTFLCALVAIRSLPHFSASEFFGNIFMLQDFAYAKPGVFVSPFLGNSPLWSLSYEWWFYMMFFPIYKFVPVQIQFPLVASLSVFGFASYLVFPNQASLFLLYFILWWAGVEMCRAVINGNFPDFRNQLHSILVLAAMVCLLGAQVFWAYLHKVNVRPGLHPVLELRHFGSALLLLCAGLFWAKCGWRGFNKIFSVFLPLAPISYGLYVLHYPVCAGYDVLKGFGPVWIQVLGEVVIVFALAAIAELYFQKKMQTLFLMVSG